MLKCIKRLICGQQKVEYAARNSVQRANSEIWRHNWNENLVQILKRQNVIGETKDKRKLCVVKRRRKISVLIRRRTVGFLIFGQKKTSTPNFSNFFFWRKKPSTFYFPAHFYFPSISQFQVKSAILTFSTCFTACIRRPLTEQYFAVCCSCPAQYGTVQKAICRP